MPRQARLDPPESRIERTSKGSELTNSTLEACKYMVVIRQELYHGNKNIEMVRC